MNPVLLFVVCAAVSYLAGAIPFAYLVARMKGIDIRKVGSGNIGATNVFRAVSKPLGILTFLLDVLKGFVSACFIPALVKDFSGDINPQILPVVCAFSAVAGHNWPVFLKFKGGKGVATSAGALLGIAPLAVAMGLAVWMAVFIPFRYVSLASISAAVIIPVSGWYCYANQGLVLPIALTLLGVLAIWRHMPNIVRLVNGTENRFRSDRKSSPPDSEQPAKKEE